ncbi:transporter substrate-binding domain-containing protein [Pacificibacter marinus]|uniref:Glutamine-binding periplasmic protein n=1 Tax=Pacificibacter marinus TaxID=658057 RepID=A0A1Y5S1U2_9RHOB|nr:transporter substrate-binding domain-containing protein [Pacificibacter marinus]SEK93424.1 amino acid ABC transporter substrate-binding protein, PAAT family [Pacificibacter marinus]SLN30386.1 Glutamine-binding periplasmic protein precursor [Pacificibacter marinus]
MQKRHIAIFLTCALWLIQASWAAAEDLTVTTVTRPPFSMVENGKDTGFSIELLDEIAKNLDWTYSINRVQNFSEMLSAVENGTSDAAIANISITAGREAVMDFTQPIFEAGLQIMTPSDPNKGSIWSIILSKDLVLAIVGAFALLLGCGMLMWRLERKHQEYFDMNAREAMFPAFWWALNLIVNGGFEERQPRTPLGRMFGVFLVISSLFFVSVFVARITAAMTVDAIQANVADINDLYGKNVGTLSGSTAGDFLDKRDIKFAGYTDITLLLEAFEIGAIDVVVFDAPILAYYVNSQKDNKARLIGQVFLAENYGIALQSNSVLSEQINQSLLELRENGTYDRVYKKWFGAR